MVHTKCSDKKSGLDALAFFSVLLLILLFSSVTKGQDKNTTIYPVDSVDTSTTFKGGKEFMYRFLVKVVRYPAEAQTKNIQGKVYLSFIVEEDGTLTDIKVESGPKGGLKEEALRVMKMSPAWEPGYRKGKPVRTRYSMPISFSLA